MRSPLITMTAVTGKPSREEIKRYLKSLKDNGIEQVMIYPRSGCEIEYLSEEWFHTVGNFIKSAEEYQMYIWLYDEFNWPSGQAGGRVTAIEDYRLKAIITKGADIGKILHKSQYKDSLFGEAYFPDLLSEEAVDYFIKCTHEAYYKRFKPYFGTVIKGMFTDEPSIGYTCDEQSIAYYKGMEEDYKAYCGRDFSEDLHHGHEDFYKDAYAVVGNRFKQAFHGKIRAWCDDHNILMTGHMMEDENPFAGTKHGGNVLKNLSTYAVPGMDDIWTDFEGNTQISLMSTVEFAAGENGAMVELFALGPIDMTYAKKRCMIYLTSCFKIDHYFLGVSHMDMRGNMKITDYFHNVASDQPDFAGMKLLGDDAREAALYAKKDFTPDVYVKYPTEIAAKQIQKKWDAKPYFDLLNEMNRNQIQWKYTDTDACGDIPVIDFTDDLAYILKNQTYTKTEDVIRNIPHTIRATDKDGNLPEGLFVRTFTDGTIMVLNLYGASGEYIVSGKTVTLYQHGVYASDKPVAVAESVSEKDIADVFSVSYQQDNMCRLMYISEQTTAKIFSETDIKVRFAVRNGVDAKLCDEPIVTNSETEGVLSDGFKTLYGVSEIVTIKSGETAVSAFDDVTYLPSVFVLGDFSARYENGEICSVHLKERKNIYEIGEKFTDFGGVEFTAEVTVPENAKGIMLEGTDLYQTVSIDGKLCDERIAPPYIFEIEKAYCGKKVCLTITQYSTLGPIFGDAGYYNQNSPTVKWVGTPIPTGTSFGFEKIRWVF